MKHPAAVKDGCALPEILCNERAEAKPHLLAADEKAIAMCAAPDLMPVPF